MSFDVEHRSSLRLRFREHVATSLGQTTVNTSNSSLRTLDLTEVNWFQETRIGPQNRGVADTTSSGDDLTTSSVDSVSVQSNVVDVNSNSSHVLLTQNSLVGSPLESSNNRVFNFVEILDPLRYIDHAVGTSLVRAEAPDFTGIGRVPTSQLIVLRCELVADNPVTGESQFSID
jgi:hypothetical protein